MITHSFENILPVRGIWLFYIILESQNNTLFFNFNIFILSKMFYLASGPPQKGEADSAQFKDHSKYGAHSAAPVKR